MPSIITRNLVFRSLAKVFFITVFSAFALQIVHAQTDYEAESGTLSGGSINIISDAGASGGQFVRGVGFSQVITFNLTGMDAGTYPMRMKYRHNSNGGVNYSVSVNGGAGIPGNFGKSATWSYDVTGDITLNAGSNTIAIDFGKSNNSVSRWSKSL